MKRRVGNPTHGVVKGAKDFKFLAPIQFGKIIEEWI